MTKTLYGTVGHKKGQITAVMMDGIPYKTDLSDFAREKVPEAGECRGLITLTKESEQILWDSGLQPVLTGDPVGSNNYRFRVWGL